MELTGGASSHLADWCRRPPASSNEIEVLLRLIPLRERPER